MPGSMTPLTTSLTTMGIEFGFQVS